MTSVDYFLLATFVSCVLTIVGGLIVMRYLR